MFADSENIYRQNSYLKKALVLSLSFHSKKKKIVIQKYKSDYQNLKL